MFFRFCSACLPHWLLGLAPMTAIDFGLKTGFSVSAVAGSDVFCNVVNLLDGGGCSGQGGGGTGLALAGGGHQVGGLHQQLDFGADLEAEAVFDRQVREQATGSRDVACDLDRAADVERLGDGGVDVQTRSGAAAE